MEMSIFAELNVDRRRAFVLGGGALAVALVGTGTTTSASASPTQPLPQGKSATGKSATLDLTDEQIAAADKFVTQNGTAYELDEAAAERELGPSATDEVRKAVEDWNESVGAGSTSGAITPQAGGKSIYTDPSRATGTALRSTSTATLPARSPRGPLRPPPLPEASASRRPKPL